MKKHWKLLPVTVVAFFLFPYAKLSTKAANAATVGQAECVMEMRSRRVLYERNGDLRLPMASTTKITTAITALDLLENVEREIQIPKEAVGIEGSSLYLKEGEIYTLKDLLYGLMLRSGNDAATAIALSVGGSVERFSAMMNATAQKSGALVTNFKNPHGLPEDGHYTTARDLSLITAYAMGNDLFREIVAAKRYEPRGWVNKNKLLTRYDGACGVKTGYTKQAGRCLVSAARRGNSTFLCVLLNCSQTYERTEQLFDDAFERYETVRLLTANEPISVIYKGKTFAVFAKEDFFYPLLKEEKELVQVQTYPNDRLNRAKKGEIVGRIEISLSKQLLFSGNLYKI